MTPLEAMAKAHWDSQREGFDHYLAPWEELPKPQKSGLVHDMRAALLALAEADGLPKWVPAPEDGSTPLFAPEDHADFRAMLRSIAEGEG